MIGQRVRTGAKVGGLVAGGLVAAAEKLQVPQAGDTSTPAPGWSPRSSFPAPALPDEPPTGVQVEERQALTDPALLGELVPPRAELTRFFLEYKFGIEEVRTKIAILQEEFLALHDHNPIEHVRSRLKSPESILDKITRKGVEPSLDSVRSTITDIAGVRVTCSFVTDVYRLLDMLCRQPDLRVLRVKDYIAEPKQNGYRSLHLLVTVPVFLSTRVVDVAVEIQLRTVAMDFWASLEHKIHYKYRADVPDDVRTQLREAAQTAQELDTMMESLHVCVHGSDVAVNGR